MWLHTSAVFSLLLNRASRSRGDSRVKTEIDRALGIASGVDPTQRAIQQARQIAPYTFFAAPTRLGLRAGTSIAPWSQSRLVQWAAISRVLKEPVAHGIPTDRHLVSAVSMSREQPRLCRFPPVRV